MDNQHKRIAGYRDLSATEIGLMNRIKQVGEVLGTVIADLRAMPTTSPNQQPYVCVDGRPSLDQRWISIGATDIQTGLMALVRGVAQPTTF